MRRPCARLIVSLAAVGLLLPAGGARGAETVPLKVTAGEELSAKDNEAVKASLSAYLAALKKGDYRAAGAYVDSKSFLANVDTLASLITTPELPRPAARRKMFGSSTTDSLAKRPFPEVFRSYMEYQESENPTMRGTLAKAEVEVLAARRVGDKVHVAYQLSLPPEGPGAEPFTSVTAEQLRKIGGKWKILFRVN